MIKENIVYDLALLEEKFSINYRNRNLLERLLDWWKYRPRKCSLPKSYKFVDKSCMENPKKEKLQFVIENKRKIRIPCKILSRTYPLKIVETIALIDTGAESCMISDNLIGRLQLKPYKTDVQMFHSDGATKTNVYECDMALSDNIVLNRNFSPSGDKVVGFENSVRC